MSQHRGDDHDDLTDDGDGHGALRGRLHQLGATPIDPIRQSADLVAMAAASAPRRSVSSWLGGGTLRDKVRVAAVFLAGMLVGSTGLATAGALPDPAQHVAHRALSTVGVDVPDPVRYHGPECGPEVKKSHGQYVSQDHTLAQSECGKPVHSRPGDDSNDSADGKAKGPGGANADKGPCQGKPPWAGNKSMTPDEKAAAQAERAARCGDEAEAEPPELEPEEDEGLGEETTTTTAPTTTTSTSTTSSTTTVRDGETTTTAP